MTGRFWKFIFSSFRPSTSILTATWNDESLFTHWGLLNWEGRDCCSCIGLTTFCCVGKKLKRLLVNNN